MVEPQKGSVHVGDANVKDQPAVALRRRIGYVQQDGGLLPHWPVLRNVGLVPTLLNLADATDRARAMLDLVGLEPARFADRFPHQLSGGQRQRVALARALAARPGIILLDEPFGAVDAITRSDLQAAFERIRAELGVTTLLVTHDLAEAARLTDRIAVMRGGRIEQQGTSDELLRQPATVYVHALFTRALASHARLQPS